MANNVETIAMCHVTHNNAGGIVGRNLLVFNKQSKLRLEWELPVFRNDIENSLLSVNPITTSRAKFYDLLLYRVNDIEWKSGHFGIYDFIRGFSCKIVWLKVVYASFYPQKNEFSFKIKLEVLRHDYKLHARMKIGFDRVKIVEICSSIDSIIKIFEGFQVNIQRESN